MNPDEALREIRLIVTDVDGILTDGKMGIDGEGRHFRHFNVRDGLGVALWRLAGLKLALVSGQGSVAVETIAEQWRVDGCECQVRDKAQAVRKLAERFGVSLDETAFVGDDLIDLEAMRLVRVGVSAADSNAAVVRAAGLSTLARGGEGVLREVIERALSVRGVLEETIIKYCHDPSG